MSVHVPAGLESFIANADSRTKAELLLAYASQESQTFIEVQMFHLGPLDVTTERFDDDNDVVMWVPQARLGKFRGVGISISLDTPHATLVRLLRKSLSMLDSCSPETWDATCQQIAGQGAPTKAGVDDDLPF